MEIIVDTVCTYDFIQRFNNLTNRVCTYLWTLKIELALDEHVFIDL